MNDNHYRSALRINPRNLKHIENQTYKDCSTAVLLEPLTLKYVLLEGSEYDDLYATAIRGLKLKSCPKNDIMKLWLTCRKPGNEITAWMIYENNAIYNTIEDPTEELHEYMAEHYPLTVLLIKEPSEKVLLLATRKRPDLLEKLSNLPIIVYETVIKTAGACAYKYIDNPTIDLLVKAMLSPIRCTCNCLCVNPQDDLERALFEAIKHDVKVLEIATFSNGLPPQIRLQDHVYIGLVKQAAEIHGLDKAIACVPNHSMKKKIRHTFATKNARTSFYD